MKLLLMDDFNYRVCVICWFAKSTCRCYSKQNNIIEFNGKLLQILCEFRDRNHKLLLDRIAYFTKNFHD